VSFIARPTEVFRAYLKSTGRIDELGFQLGRMSMALEIITQIKALEELRAIASDLGRAEAVSALDTLLQDCRLRDIGYEWYDKLCEWRRVSLLPLPVVLHEHVPAGIAAVVDADGPRLLGTIHEISSGPASPEVETAPDSTPPAEPEERHGQELDGPSSFLPGGVPWREE
jgi:hypothetical protein